MDSAATAKRSDAWGDGGAKLRICVFVGALAWLLLHILMSVLGQGLLVAARVAELSGVSLVVPRERGEST